MTGTLLACSGAILTSDAVISQARKISRTISKYLGIDSFYPVLHIFSLVSHLPLYGIALIVCRLEKASQSEVFLCFCMSINNAFLYATDKEDTVSGEATAKVNIILTLPRSFLPFPSRIHALLIQFILIYEDY